jgi:signal transduction histidine kinase
MSQRSVTSARVRALAVALGALGVAIGLASGAFGIASWASFHSISDLDLPSVIIPIGSGILGALVATRQPRNPVGWLFLFVSIVGGLQGVAGGYALIALVTHRGLAGGIWALWLASWVVTLVFPAGALTFLLLLFPDGHLPSRRWRPVAVTATVVTVLLAIPAGALASGPLVTNITVGARANPIGIPVGGVLGTVLSALGLLWLPGLAILVVAAAAPLVRMRHAQGDERHQLKWIAYAVIVSAVAYMPVILPSFFVPTFPTWLGDGVIALGFGVAVPVAAGIAIFKHRLYDIDVVISRTLVYGALALFITAVYVGIAVGIGALIGGGGKPNLGLSILATAIVAVGFQPARQWLQKVANRLVYGQRATPYQVLSQFSERVAESYAVDDVLPRMARVLAEGTGAQHAVVWLRTGTVLRAAASWPVDAGIEAIEIMNGTVRTLPDTDRVVEVRQQNELLGALSVTKRARESLTPIEDKLLSDLAHQAGLMLRNVRLTADLQARLEDLRASRQRLVAAQDNARRRLERNLHDGAQQHLVAIKVKLGLVEMLLTRDPARAGATIVDLKHDADEALETLRDLARGIYPPLLADKGLAAALRSQAGKATVPVHVDADGVGRHSQEIEAALYFCTLEALQNVQKYAAASTVQVRLREEGGQVCVEVTDDGCGFDVRNATRGAGLTNMEDRLDALGGTLQIESTPGGGTTLRATVPVPSPVVAVN